MRKSVTIYANRSGVASIRIDIFLPEIISATTYKKTWGYDYVELMAEMENLGEVHFLRYLFFLRVVVLRGTHAKYFEQ